MANTKTKAKSAKGSAKKKTTGNSKPKEETFKVKGEFLLQKVKEVLHEGNVRKIIIKDKTGKTIAEFPLTFGVVGALLTPVLAAVGAIAVLVTECSVTVVRD
jgi:hypothetical protein